MVRPSLRPFILALALAACRDDSDSSAPFAVQSVSVPDFGLWECNRPIEFAFDRPIDFASVSARSIHIRTSAGVQAAGTFGAKSVDSNGDGAKDGTDERVVVFFPSCPQADDLSDAGLTPGLRYLVTLAGEDSTQDPTAVVRSLSGEALARTLLLAFETIADPASTLYDGKPGPPMPLLRAAGASVGLGTYLELGEDPGNRTFFEGDSSSGRAPNGFRAPLNLLGDRSTQVAVVVVFDQLIREAPENLARLRLEYNSMLAATGWSALETRTELLSNCGSDDPAVRLVPLGSFPPGGFVRAHVDAGFEDFVGEATSAPLDAFAIVELESVAFTSLDPAGAIADELREEFDFGPGSALSLADSTQPLDAALAEWGEGELRGGPDFFALPPELSEFDWVVREVFTFDTEATAIAGGPGGAPVTVQETTGGLVFVRDLVVEQGRGIRVRGPNPMVVHASGSVTILGTIDASGFDAPIPDRSFAIPAAGGLGVAGGGDGGTGSPGTASRGGTGLAAFGAGGGGQGGETGFTPETLDSSRRGGGGGGGRFARNQGPLVAEPGGNGSNGCKGAESRTPPPRGGAPGQAVFVDGDDDNDFLGIQPVVDASGAVIARRRGELGQVHAGAGGGSGGDAIFSETFPPTGAVSIQEGGGGGGGGGALVIRALGPIVLGPSALIRANGGRGADRRMCGGSGSGGHVILQSGEQIVFEGARIFIQAVGGPRTLSVPDSGPRGAGGAGGPGVIQLHVPNPERGPRDPESNLILPPAALARSDPLAVVCQPNPIVLYPALGLRSRARSRWIPLGAAGEGTASGPESVVAFLFDGIETAPGEDEGKVRTRDGRVPELAPLLGPLRLSQPGVELLSDGLSLALSGSVLAPLRASAEPISPDVYLRTPALLEGFTLRLANPPLFNVVELTIADARYDDATSRLTLAVGGLTATLDEVVQALGGPSEVDLALIPRFFRVRQGPLSADLLPDSRFVRILFQGATDDGTGRADEASPLVDWTGDVGRFGLLPPGALDFVRFQVEFEFDATETSFDPEAEPLALEFLRLPFRY